MRRGYLFFLFTLLLAACSNNEQFRVNGTIEGDPTLNLRVGWYADGSYHSLITAAREGKFEFFCTANQPAVVAICDNDSRILARIYAKNGETFDLKLKNDPYQLTVDGNDISKRWATFLRENADELRQSPRAANEAIARYVIAHPDDLLSSLLLVNNYYAAIDPLKADSLLSLLTPQARPSAITESFNYSLSRLVTGSAAGEIASFPYRDRRDSLRYFNPHNAPLSFLAVSMWDDYRIDSVVPALRRLTRKSANRELKVLDYSAELDTIGWRELLQEDSVHWDCGWAPGGITARGLDKLGLQRIPFFIVADSTGRQLYRGSSVGEAEKLINTFLHAR